MVVEISGLGEGAWKRVAADVAEGWLITSSDSTGDMRGRIEGASGIEGGILFMKVRWADDDLEGSLHIPIRRRNLRLIDRVVLISGSDSLITLEPAKD